ncbi:hypothetical protein [Phaffia rhodozyma]|uniref:Uncharacterized protein n=1 Tax=Phaffia rhodozyma TaxID=264483 RepID=A0A0F7SPE7_PHARH|nr:hypothetical protein [Phaffia rhodozyma]
MKGQARFDELSLSPPKHEQPHPPRTFDRAEGCQIHLHLASQTVLSANQTFSSEVTIVRSTHIMSRSSSDSATTLVVSSTPDTVPGSSVSSTSSTPRMPRRSQTPPPSPPSPSFPSFVSSARSIHHSDAYPFMLDREAVERRRLRKVKKLEEKLAWEESCRKEREARNRREVEEWERKQQEIKAAAAVTAVATTITTISIEAPPITPTPDPPDVPADEAILTPVVAIESPGPEPTPIQVQTAPSIPPSPLILPKSGSSEPVVNVNRRIEIEILDSDSDSDDEIQIIESCPKPVVSSRASLPNTRLLPISPVE